MERTRAAYFSASEQELVMETYEEFKHLIASVKKAIQPLSISLEKMPGRRS